MIAIPDDIAEFIQEMPADFSPAIETGNATVWFTQQVSVGDETITLELGYPKPQDPATDTTKRAALKQAIWQALELARLGRKDLLRIATTERHLRQ